MIRTEALDSFPLFRGLGRQALREIAGALHLETWPKGRQILGPADTARRFSVVTRGRVKVVRANAHDGREFMLWLLGPGDGFDVVSLLDGAPHAVSVWALDEAATVSAPMAAWRDWLERFPRLRLNVHREAGEKLRAVAELAADLALYDTPTRLAHLLLRNFDPAGPNLLIDLPHKELAAMIGSVRVVVSRLLGQMRREGIVELRHGNIQAVDLKRLLQLAEQQLARRHGGSHGRETDTALATADSAS